MEKSSDLESSVWLNGILNWFFLNLSDSLPFKQGIHQIVSEIVVDIRRSPLGYFIIDSQLKGIQMGGTAPRIEGSRIITGSSLKEPTSDDPLSVQFDLELDEGGCGLEIDIQSIFFQKVSIGLIIKAFKGSICLVIQDRTIHFCFIGEPSKLEIDTKISFKSGGMNSKTFQVPFLNYLFSSRLVRKGVGAGFAFPKFLNQWYRAGPEQPPYPWNPIVINDPELLYNWTPKSD